MEKVIFAISDIHGHYTEAINALQDAGYDEGNTQHFLIVCGDIFDRGEENVAIYKWLKRITSDNKGIVIRGNHDTMMIDFLEYSNNPFNYMNNGTNTTIDDFLGRTRSFESYCLVDKKCQATIGAFADFSEIARREINMEYPDLLPWLKNMPWYYETKNYIFTHASIDTSANDWRYPHYIRSNKTDWDALSWDDGSFFGKTIYNTDKRIVIGHFSTAILRDIYHYPIPLLVPKDEEEAKINVANGLPNKHGILIRNDNKIIALDGCTIASKQVNVLKIESEELLDDEERRR